MTDRKITEEKEKDATVLDLQLAKFTEPDVSEVVNDAQIAPKIIGKIITVIILISIIILGFFIIKDKIIVVKQAYYITAVSVFFAIALIAIKVKYELDLGKYLKKMWIFVFIIFPISTLMFFLFVAPAGKAILTLILAERLPTGTLQWWKNRDVYGNNPEIRTGGPFDVKITRNDSILIFKVKYLHRGSWCESVFKGEKETAGRFEGTWSQIYPEDGGNWYLIPDANNPRFFRGQLSEKPSGAWINFSLKIDP